MLTLPPSASTGRGPSLGLGALVILLLLPTLPATAQIQKQYVTPVAGIPSPASYERAIEVFPAYEQALERTLATPRENQGLRSSTLVQLILDSLREASGPERPATPFAKGDHPEWAGIYARAAPAVLFLMGDNTTGTGFVVDREGLVLTNHHVASAGVFDRSERTWKLQVYRGEIDAKGRMLYQSEPITATVYAWDRERDLALLKLEDTLFLEERVEPLLLASADGSSPRPGEDVALIGNAGIGMLWSMKPGHVSAIGQLSSSTPNVLNMLNSIALSSASVDRSNLDVIRDRIEEFYRDWIGVDTRLIQATAVASPGDSGGPLLNGDGEVVGIAMGILSHKESSTTASYFVHLDELKAFLDREIGGPMIELARDIWGAPAVNYSLGPLAGGSEGSALLGLDAAGKPLVMALDLDASGESAAYRAETTVTTAVAGVHALGLNQGYVAIFGGGDLVGLDPSFTPVWHQETGQNVFCSNLSRDRTHGAVGLSDGSLVLFDARTGEQKGRWRFDGTPVFAVEFAPDSQGLWVATQSGTLWRFSLDGQVLDQIQSNVPAICTAASPDGSLLAVVTHDGTLSMLRAEDASVVWALPGAKAMQVRFDPGGESVMVSPKDGLQAIRRFAAEDGAKLGQVRLPLSPYFFEISEDGRRIVVSLEGGEHALCDVQSGELLARWPTVVPAANPLAAALGGNGPSAIEFELIGNALVTGGRDGVLYRVPDLDANELVRHSVRIEGVDVAGMVRDQAFDAEFSMVLDYEVQTVYALYDLDNDGRFERVRLDDDGDGLVDAEFELDGSTTTRRASTPDEALLLPPDQLPPAWGKGYAAYVSGQS